MNGVTARAIFRPRSDLGQFVKARITPAVRMATEESCQLIYDRSQELVPVRSGALKASGKIIIEETGKTIIGTVGYNTGYEAYVEYGTGIRGVESEGAGEGPYSPTWPGMAAQPFMRPAIDESRDKIRNIFSNDVGISLK